MKYFIIILFVISVVFLVKYINEYSTIKNKIGETKIAKEFLIKKVNGELASEVTFTKFARHESNVSGVLKMF